MSREGETCEHGLRARGRHVEVATGAGTGRGSGDRTGADGQVDVGSVRCAGAEAAKRPADPGGVRGVLHARPPAGRLPDRQVDKVYECPTPQPEAQQPRLRMHRRRP